MLQAISITEDGVCLAVAMQRLIGSSKWILTLTAHLSRRDVITANSTARVKATKNKITHLDHAGEHSPYHPLVVAEPTVTISVTIE